MTLLTLQRIAFGVVFAFSGCVALYLALYGRGQRVETERASLLVWAFVAFGVVAFTSILECEPSTEPDTAARCRLPRWNTYP